MNHPWMKFYPADWRADPALRMCSLAARGLWIDLLCYMHEGKPYGHLTINGARPKLDQIASLVGRPSREVEKAFGELVSLGVCSTEDGAIVSRRMVRDKTKADRDKENGKGGGNPDLRKGVNPPDNPTDNGVDKAQKLEARSQNPERKKEPSLRSGPRSTGSRLPENWEPTNEEVAFAMASGLSAREVEIERDKFRDHWRSKAGKDGLKRDWSAAWRNWIRRSLEMNRGPPRGGSPRPGSREDRQEKTANAIAQLTDFIAAGTDDEPGSGDVGEAPSRLLPFAKSA